MLNIKYIKENIPKVKKAILHKNVDCDLDFIISLDDKRKEIILEVEKLKAERNIKNKSISIYRTEKKDSTDLINEMKKISSVIKDLDIKLSKIQSDLNDKLLYVPNILHESVPIGKDESANIVVREWGSKPKFDYQIKNHKQLCDLNGLVDFKRSVKMSGSGFPLYTNEGAKLERSLINFMLDLHVTKHDYNELFPPFLVNSNSPLTTGNLPKFKEDMYYIENDDLFCIPTAEVPVTNIHADEILIEKELPIKYVAYSACYRREAGSYGRDTMGLLRLHQFNKVELVKFCHPKSSYDELELLLNNAETILQKLNLHYRVVSLSSGDLSFSATKCYDIEVWSPGENKYIEVSSCSNFESFQARRGNIKFRNTETEKLEFVHTLNGSGLATPRLMIALLETYQQRDGTIDLPSKLNKYMKFFSNV